MLCNQLPVEQLPDALKSLGDDAAILFDFKLHAGLPPDPDWTEQDRQLKRLLNLAETAVDKQTGHPCRLRSFRAQVSGFEKIVYNNTAYPGFKIPRCPVVGDVSITWTASDETTGTYGTADLTLYGANTLKPVVLFAPDFEFPDVSNIAFPYTVTWSAGYVTPPDAHLVTIYELAAFYYRFPEAAFTEQLPISHIFNANMDLLANSFL